MVAEHRIKTLILVHHLYSCQSILFCEEQNADAAAAAAAAAADDDDDDDDYDDNVGLGRCSILISKLERN